MIPEEVLVKLQCMYEDYGKAYTIGYLVGLHMGEKISSEELADYVEIICKWEKEINR